jgi:hypothetical protein
VPRINLSLTEEDAADVLAGLECLRTERCGSAAERAEVQPLIDLLDDQIAKHRKQEAYLAAEREKDKDRRPDWSAEQLAIRDQIRQAAGVVSTWPPWKQNILSNSLSGTLSEPRKPIVRDSDEKKSP